MSCRSKLAVLNEKLTTLERKIDYLEACVSLAFILNKLLKIIKYYVNFRSPKEKH